MDNQKDIADRYLARLNQFKTERSSWEAHWRDISDYIAPTRLRISSTDANRGDKKGNRIIDNTSVLALRTLQAGMMSGITSPARPWFILTAPDPDMNDYMPVKAWLDTTTRRILDVIAKSNVYNVLNRIYGDIGGFGTACASIMEDPKTVIRGYDLPCGSYYLGQNDRLEVDTLIRGPWRMTVRQVVDQFGLDHVSTSTANLYKTGKFDQWIDVAWFVTPNTGYDGKKLESKFKLWKSCYLEMGGTGNAGASGAQFAGAVQVLSEGGFDEFPILSPRWETTGEDVYGRGPGMDALGDVKSLQTYERTTAQAVEKMVKPALIAPTALRNARVSQVPGDITYYDSRDGQSGLKPLHEVNFRVDIAEQKSDVIRKRIERTFYADLFLMLANDTREQPATAREIAERHEEKLLALGPVLERLNGELLKPLVDRTFSIMLRRGLISPPPAELQGADLKIEYVSIMAQAQKMVGLVGIERTVGFATQCAQLNPEASDKIDFDQLMDAYGDNVGLAPKIIRSDDDVAKIRQQRAQQQAQQQQLAAAHAASATAKNLAQAPTDGGNALSDLMDTVGAPTPGA